MLYCMVLSMTFYSSLKSYTILKDSSPNDLVRSLHTVGYSEHYHCYSVKSMDNLPLSIVTLQDTVDHYPLEMYQSGDRSSSYIIPK